MVKTEITTITVVTTIMEIMEIKETTAIKEIMGIHHGTHRHRETFLTAIKEPIISRPKEPIATIRISSITNG